MPPKSKRRRQLEKILQNARETKRRRKEGLGPMQDAEPTEEMSSREDETEEQDPTFDEASAKQQDKEYIQESFCEEWISQMNREDKISLALFLSFQIPQHFDLGATETAEVVGMMIGKSERTVREWRSEFFENGGKIREGRQGKYPRAGVLWNSVELNEKACKFIRENSGETIMSVPQFRQWVNGQLLTNEHLEPEYPKTISIETARRWMHEIGLPPLSPSITTSS